MKFSVLAMFGILVVISIVTAAAGHCDGPQSHRPRCPIKFCPHIYKPVCARNGYGHYKTFANRCLLDAANCNLCGRARYRFRYNGPCHHRC